MIGDPEEDTSINIAKSSYSSAVCDVICAYSLNISNKSDYFGV